MKRDLYICKETYMRDLYMKRDLQMRLICMQKDSGELRTSYGGGVCTPMKRDLYV